MTRCQKCPNHCLICRRPAAQGTDLDIDDSDIHDAINTLLLGVRHTLRTELTSAWLPIQLGLILLTALVAIGIAALLRRRYDVAAATMGLPAYLRLFGRTLAANVPQIIFIILIVAERAGIRASMLHSRTYLLHVAANLAIAWVVIALVASLIRNQFVNRIVAVLAWTIAALGILRLLDAGERCARFGLPHARRSQGHAAARDQDLGAADRRHLARGRRQQFLRTPRAAAHPT